MIERAVVDAKLVPAYDEALLVLPMVDCCIITDASGEDAPPPRREPAESGRAEVGEAVKGRF